MRLYWQIIKIVDWLDFRRSRSNFVIRGKERGNWHLKFFFILSELEPYSSTFLIWNYTFSKLHNKSCCMIQKYQKETNKTNTTQVMKISSFYMRKKNIAAACEEVGWSIKDQQHHFFNHLCSDYVLCCSNQCMSPQFPIIFMLTSNSVTKLDIINLCQIYWLKHSQNYYCFIVITKIIIGPDFLHEKIFLSFSKQYWILFLNNWMTE